MQPGRAFQRHHVGEAAGFEDITDGRVGVGDQRPRLIRLNGRPCPQTEYAAGEPVEGPREKSCDIHRVGPAGGRPRASTH